MAKSTTKKKAKTNAAPPATKRAKPKAAKSQPTYYVVATAVCCDVTDEKPPAGNQARGFATFDEARGAAVEALVELIEAAESHLHALKRATSLSECRAAAKHAAR